MNVIHEVAMLVAVASPVAVIAAINLALYLAGERGTLLLPARAQYPVSALEMLPRTQAPAASVAELESEEEMRLAA